MSAPAAIHAIDSALHDELVEVRRDLHAHPELAWKETRTAGRVAAFLDRYGIAHRTGVAGTGVVADLPGAVDGPAVALRADMDALPIVEETGLPFAATNGAMHACGHDAHTTMLLGAAALLAREDERPAPVRLIFQPAEEIGDGAKAMIEAGALDGVAAIFGGHVDRHYTLGTIVAHEGTVNASTDTFRIEVHGAAAHAARPHEGLDAIVVGTLIVTALQTIVSREVNPAHPSVVTIGRFDAGTAPNVIAGHAVLEGTVRAQESDVREHLVAAVERMARAAAQLHGATIDFTLTAGTPPVINRAVMVGIAREAALSVVGAEHVRGLDAVNMGAEDFAQYLQHVPGCYVRIGSQVPGKEAYPAHSSRFDVDEGVLGLGAAYPAHSSRFDVDEGVLGLGAAYYRAVALAAGRRLREGRLVEAEP